MSVHSDHKSRSHSYSMRHPSRDQEMNYFRMEVGHLRWQLRQRVHIRKHRMPSPSPSSNSEGEWSYRRRTKSPQSSTYEAPPHSFREKRRPHQRSRTPLQGNMEDDAMSKALRQISPSPFSDYIEDTELPHRFAQLAFTIYNGWTNLIEHMSHFNQRIAIHSENEALMCKVFPSSLSPTAMRWFDGLKEDSIWSCEELTRAFGARFVTCSRVPKIPYFLQL